MSDERLGRLLWALVAIGTALLAYVLYSTALGQVPLNANGFGGDFWGLLRASRDIASGVTPYRYTAASLYNATGYVYSPFVAVLLLPFIHLPVADVFQGWTLVSIGLLIATIGIVTFTEVPREPSWQRPFLFGTASIMCLHYSLTINEIFNGQSDAFIIALLALSIAGMRRKQWATSAIFIAITGLIKTWPGAAVIALLARRWGPSTHKERRRAIAIWLVTVAVAPILTVLLGGISELRGWLRITVAARSQHLVSFSVWGTPRILFGRSGITAPLTSSPALQVLTTVVLAAWVGSLLFISLRYCEDSTIGAWQVVVCIVLLLPSSHEFYLLYTLPLLWTWIARTLAIGPPRIAQVVLVGLLLTCWYVTTLNWPIYTIGHRPWTYVALFVANLGMATLSTLGERLRLTKPTHEVASGSLRY